MKKKECGSDERNVVSVDIYAHTQREKQRDTNEYLARAQKLSEV